MAKILIQSDEGWPLVTIQVHTDDEGWTSGDCPECRETISVRGRFEDTIEEISSHLDMEHAE